MNNKKLQALTDTIVCQFGAENVVCILLHGSVIFNPHLSQDVDLVIVLKQQLLTDCTLLRRIIVKSKLSKFPIQLHLFYLEEIPTDADFCSINTCGPFIVWHIRQAKVLFGNNVYDKVVGPSNYQLQISLLQKFQQYTFQLRNTLCKVGDISDSELFQARKRSVVVLKDLLMSEGTLIQHETEIVHRASSLFKDFSIAELGFLEQITTKWKKPISKKETRQFLQQCLTIHNRAYSIMRMRMVNNGKCRFIA